MNRTHTAIAAAAILAAGLTSVAHAQFSMPSIPGVTKSGGAAAPAADLPSQQDALVRGYVAASKDVLYANAKLADALGLKDDAAKVKAEADSFQEGATKDNAEAANKAVATSTDLVAKKIATQPAMDAQSKAVYGQGLVLLASGVTKYVAVGKDVTNMGNGIKGASPLQLPKLQSAIYVVTKFPDAMTSVSGAMKNAVSFAQSSGVPVPSDASAAAAAL
jgi:hypothetical protein